MDARFIIRVFAITLALWFGLTQAFAYDVNQVISVEKEVEGYRSDLERIQGVVNQGGVTDEQLVEQKRLLEAIRVDATGIASKLRDPLNELNQQLAQLGAAPTDGQLEPASLAKQRSDLNALVERVLAAKKQIDLVALEAEQQASKVSSLQRGEFFRRIFNPGKSIFNPSMWKDTVAGFDLLGQRVSALVRAWWLVQSPQASFLGLLLLPGVAFSIWAISRFFGFSFGNINNAKVEPNGDIRPRHRLWRVISGSLGVYIVSVLISILGVASFKLAGLWTDRISAVFDVFAATLIPTAFQTVLAWLVCSPLKPEWRLVNIDEKTASRLPVLVFSATFIQAGAKALGALSDKLYLPVTLTVGQSALAATLLIILISMTLHMLKKQANAAHDVGDRPIYLAWFVNLIPLLWVLVAISTLALISGYIALSYFIVGQILDTTLLIAFLYLIHHWADALADSLLEAGSSTGGFLRRFAGFGDRGINRFALLFRTLTDIILVILGIPALFALWTVTWVDFQSLLNTAVLGFRIGNFAISPFTVLSVIALFFAGIVLTRFMSRWLDRRVLSQTKMNRGVQDSVRTGFNYMGYIFTAAFALSAAGINFSNIAIIAGALGVGIGFGLQSIVNNFVSGLILLAERPVRVGDWVVTSAGEGVVRKINVRSTEIETFDSCSIIVPNSNLITEPVRNWMHRDTSGRFLVTVGVAYGTDVDVVTLILKDILKQHPKVLRYPEPLVQLARFAPIALEFELRAHVSDIFEGAEVASQIRYSIVKDFAAKGIVIPAATEFAKLK